MTAREYRDTLLRHWRFIMLLALATGLGALVASQFMTHRYRSFALVEIIVNPANPSAASVLQGGNLIATQVQLVTSTPVLQRVAQNYTGLNEAQIAAEVQASPYGNTSTILQISVLDPSPARAASLANDVAAAVIAQQKQSLDQQNALALKPLQDQVNTIEQDIENTTATLANLSSSPSNAQEQARLQAHLSDLKTQKSTLEANISQIRVEQALKGFTMQVAQPARPDFTPVRPVVWANAAVGVLFGIIAGMLILLGWGLLSQRTPASEDVIASFGWQYLTSLAATPQAYDDKLAGKETTGVTGVTRGSDPYQQIESALRLWDIETPVRSLVISSLGAEETAQQVAAQLALRLAASGDRTLLVDANVEHPSLSSWFGIEGQPGLRDAAIAFQSRTQSEQTIKDVLQSPTTFSAPNLRIVSAGGSWPNPVRVFRSAAMGRLMEALPASGAQRVIYSAPPLLLSGAARALAHRTDGILLVIDPERVRRDKVQHANSLLAQEGIRVLGYILAREPDRPLAHSGDMPSDSEAHVKMPPLEVVRTRHDRS